MDSRAEHDGCSYVGCRPGVSQPVSCSALGKAHRQYGMLAYASIEVCLPAWAHLRHVVLLGTGTVRLCPHAG